MESSCWDLKLPLSAEIEYIKTSEKALMSIKADFLLDLVELHILRSSFAQVDIVSRRCYL